MASCSPNEPAATSIRRASKADIDGIARALARAFENDPVWEWFLPDEASRAGRLQLMFATFTRQMYLRHGDDCFTTDGYTGAALWAPPGHGEMSAADTQSGAALEAVGLSE